MLDIIRIVIAHICLAVIYLLAYVLVTTVVMSS